MAIRGHKMRMLQNQIPMQLLSNADIDTRLYLGLSCPDASVGGMVIGGHRAFVEE